MKRAGGGPGAASKGARAAQGGRRVLFISGAGKQKFVPPEEHAGRLREAGFTMIAGGPQPGFLRTLDDAPPDAALIDVGRSLAMGRDVALWLRQRKALRAVPIVFVGADTERAATLRALLPHASFTSWARAAAVLRTAVSRPAPALSSPAPSLLAGYSGTPLPRKLGIKEGALVVLIGAPDGFEKTLGELPAGVRVVRRASPRSDLTLWFPAARRELERDVRKRGTAATEKGGIWIVWPKKASGVATDLTENHVRAAGLANGLVDFKICAIDATWSGLRFARRRL